jgi:hypothetical protein
MKYKIDHRFLLVGSLTCLYQLIPLFEIALQDRFMVRVL